MLVFITTVRHPQNSINYQRVESLLKRTLYSVCNQTDQDFRLVVVCNKIPEFSPLPDKVDFVKVNFPPPSQQKGAGMDISDSRRDKGTKAFVGLLHARQYKPDFVMFIDADDIVSNRIADYVNSHPNENGWFLKEGYIYGDGGVLIRWTHQFHMKCGSAHIINWRLLDVPADVPAQISQDEILRVVNHDFLKKVLSTHRETVDFYISMGFPTKPLPFFGGIWILDTGENRSGKSLMGLGYPVSDRIKKEFNLEIPTLTPKLVKDYVLNLPSSAGKLFTKIQEKVLSSVL